MRSCVVTRERRPPTALLRLALDEDGVLQLSRPGQTGRGAWIVPEESAVQLLAKRPQILRRSLRAVPRRLGPILAAARAAEDAALAKLLLRSWRSGLLRLGEPKPAMSGWLLTPRATAAAPPSPPRAPRSRRKGRRAEIRWTPPPLPALGETLSLPFTEPQLAALLGRSSVNTLQLAPGRPARGVLQGLQRRHGLGYGAAPSATAPDVERSPPSAAPAERASLSGQIS